VILFVCWAIDKAIPAIRDYIIDGSSSAFGVGLSTNDTFAESDLNYRPFKNPVFWPSQRLPRVMRLR
jgi:hypothetical protein